MELQNFLKVVLPICTIAISQMLEVSAQGLSPGSSDVRKPDYTMTEGMGMQGGVGADVSSASLKSFVNMQTGAVVYNVPFFDVDGHSLSTSVAIKYYSNGVRVDQESVPVGLGWALNAGGAITRKLKGIPDEAENGFLSLGAEIADYFSKSSDQKKAFINAVGEQTKDAEPDLFQFSYPGGSGHFTFDHEGDIVIYPQQKLKIDYTTLTDGDIYSIVITTGEGYEYHFGGDMSAVEVTTQSSLSVPINKNDVFEGLSVYRQIDPGVYEDYGGKSDEFVPTPFESCESFIGRWYTKSNEPGIDYGRLEEKEGITFNSKWYLVKIVHPNREAIVFSYRKLENQVVVQRPIVNQSDFDFVDRFLGGTSGLSNPYYAPGAPVGSQEIDTHYYPYEFTCEERLVEFPGEYRTVHFRLFPRFLVYDYRKVNPDFTPIPNYSYVYPGGLDILEGNIGLENFPQYSPPSWNYTLNLNTRSTIVLDNIRTSIQTAVFKYSFQHETGPVLKSLSLTQDNVLLKEVILDNEVITSEADHGNQLNLIESILAKNADFQGLSIQDAENLNYIDFAISNELLDKYVRPGFNEGVFKRVILKGVVLKSGDQIRRLASFEYNSPESLPRKNSLNKSNLNYFLDTDVYMRMVRHSSGEAFSNVFITAAHFLEGAPDIGMLSKVKLETGGSISFSYSVDRGARLSEIEYMNEEDQEPIAIYIDYVQREYDSDNNRFSEESTSSIGRSVPMHSFQDIKYIIKHDGVSYVPKLRVSSSEFINDVTWFNNDFFHIGECWIDYNGNGKEVYKFVTNADIAGQVDLDERFVHFIPGESFFVFNNGVFEETTHSQVEGYDRYPYTNIHLFHYISGVVKEYFVLNSNDEVVKRSVYNYQYNYPSYEPKSVMGLKLGRLDRGHDYDRGYRSGKYTLKSLLSHLESVENYDFETGGSAFLNTVSQTELDAMHHGVKKQTGPGKDENTQLVKFTLYPEDYTNSSGFIGKMKELNMLSVPIEVVTYQVLESGEIEILSAELTEFNASDPTKIENRYHLELNRPLPLANFKFSNVATGVVPASGSTGGFDKYPGYVQDEEEREYDEFNRVYASRGNDEIWNSTLFDEKLNRPVANIANQKIEFVAIPDVIVRNHSNNVSEENTLSAGISINSSQSVKISTTFSGSQSGNPVLRITVTGVDYNFQQEFYTSEFSINLNLEPGKYNIHYHSLPAGYYSKSLRIEYYNLAADALFTSFEEGTTSEIARSGRGIYNGSTYTFTRQIDNPSDYVVSYWAYVDGKWRFSGNLPFEQTISLSSPIDDLRMHKKNARMVSYVYDEKGRVVSELDEKGIAVKMEYDEFDRLIIERDYDNNITKKVEYFILGNN